MSKMVVKVLITGFVLTKRFVQLFDAAIVMRATKKIKSFTKEDLAYFCLNAFI